MYALIPLFALTLSQAPPPPPPPPPTCDKVGDVMILHPGIAAPIRLVDNLDIIAGTTTVTLTLNSDTCVAAGTLVNNSGSLPTLSPARNTHVGPNWTLVWDSTTVGDGQIIRIDIFNSVGQLQNTYDFSVNIKAKAFGTPGVMSMPRIPAVAQNKALRRITIDEPKAATYTIAPGGTLYSQGPNGGTKLVGYLLRRVGGKIDSTLSVIGGETKTPGADWHVDFKPKHSFAEAHDYLVVIRGAAKGDKSVSTREVGVKAR